MRRTLLLLAVVLPFASFAGCYLPIATGSPQSAATVGKGNFGGSFNGEAPTVNLIAETGDSDELTEDGYAPVAAGTLSVAYGITDTTDIEGSIEGSMYFFVLPLPTGASLGLRQNLLTSDSLDISLAGRIGAVGTSDKDENGNGDSASAKYGAASITAQLVAGSFRPLVSAQVIGASIHRDIDDIDDTFGGIVTSSTVALLYQGERAVIGPYVTASWLATDEFESEGLISVGISVGLHPDRHAPPRPVLVSPPAPQPQPYPQPAPQPYPPAPAPAPAPAPLPPPAPVAPTTTTP